jgi:hypothetical protein
MSRLANALLQPDSAYGAGMQAPMLDLQFGGQMGYSPDLTEWVSSQSYVRKNLICLLVEAPRGFAYLPNPEAYVATLRALVELHPMSIEGLTNTLTVDTATNPVGGAGQMMDDITNVTEARSEVTFRFNEKYGMPVANFFSNWIRYLIMDPNTKVPLIATLGDAPSDMLADMYASTMCFIEPDPTHTRVVKSWLGTNMYPKTSGEITGKRDLTTAQDTVTHDVGFTGIYQFGAGVDQFAQRLLDGISLTGANPHLRPAFVQEITADVQAARKGYETNVEDLGASALRV